MLEAYKIAVRVSLINNVSSGLLAMSQHFAKVNGNAAQLQQRLDKIKTTMLIGGGAVAAGAFGFRLFDGAIKSADKYYHQLALLKNIGMSQAEVAETVKTAWQTTHDVMSTKASDNIKTLLELRSAFGDGKYHEALAILPTVQRMGAVLQSITGAPQDHVGFDMIKAIELGTKGALSEDGVKKQAEMMSQAIVAMNGTVTVADFHQALKYSRSAAPYLSDDFKYKYLPTLIQEMKTGKGGASGAGNAIASLYGLIAGRMIPKELIQNWVDSGLVDKSKVVADPHSRTTSKILPGGIVGSGEFAANPEAYALKYIKPAIARLQAQKGLSEVDAFYALTKNRVTAFALQTLVNKSVQFERDRALIEKAPNSLQAYNRLARTDPELARQQLGAQWENLKIQLAYDVMPKLIKAFGWMAAKVSEIVKWMETHRTAVGAFVNTFLLLSTVLTVGGTLTLLKGAVSGLGLVFTAVGGLGTAAAAIVNPIGLAVAAIATIAAAVYAFRPMSQSEIDSYKTDGGVRLTPGAQARINAGELSRGVTPGAGGGSGKTTGVVNLDGRLVGNFMADHLGRQASGPMTGTSNFDVSMGLPTPGLGYQR
ncbi:hypothetical protein [Paraburkholderia atlantica]|uniref:hypothetical protein n=1 Tax=Paraburkholderia atlantica TaxID=2654982 RepID=UPI00160A0EF6|nr:hypothetical protein [Paraburkholderia atlantica]MBB5508161.1 hypothetical protein [Paraburkholderia atlantica]